MREPPDLFERVERQLEAMRRLLMPANRADLDGPEWAPAMDVFEQDGVFAVQVELPGVGKRDVTVSLNDGLLSITGHVEKEGVAKGARFRRCERFSVPFRRIIALPQAVDADRITTRFENGVLEVLVPLNAQEKSMPEDSLEPQQ